MELQQAKNKYLVCYVMECVCSTHNVGKMLYSLGVVKSNTWITVTFREYRSAGSCIRCHLLGAVTSIDVHYQGRMYNDEHKVHVTYIRNITEGNLFMGSQTCGSDKLSPSPSSVWHVTW
jgi:hypothetical protein